MVKAINKNSPICIGLTSPDSLQWQDTTFFHNDIIFLDWLKRYAFTFPVEYLIERADVPPSFPGFP